VPIERLSGSSGNYTALSSSAIVMDSTPVGLGDGVLRVMVLQCASGRAVTTPVGWTEWLDVNVGSGHLYVATHWATDAEVAANTSFSFQITGGTTYGTWRCNNWSGVDPDDPFDVDPFVSQHTFSDTQWNVPGMITLTPGAMAFWMIGFGPTASSAARVLTPQATLWTVDTGGQRNSPSTGTASGYGMQTCYETRAVAGATGTRNVTISGSSLAATLWRSVGFALRPYVAPAADLGDWFEAMEWAAPSMTAPGDVLDIGAARSNHFAVQLAAPDAASIETHDQDEISAGYRFYPWFYGRSDGQAVVLRAPVAGPTTSGASSTRCELRELDPGGSNAAFDALTGTHVLHVRVKALHLPPVLPDTVFAQLHNGTTDRVAIRTQLVTGTTRLRARVNGSSLTPEIANWGAGGLGEEFEAKIQLVDGLLSIFYNDMVTPLYTSSALVSTGSASWYFKTGCYLQTPASGATDNPLEYGEVEIRDLYHSHA
jgi:hypothetical protein